MEENAEDTDSSHRKVSVGSLAMLEELTFQNTLPQQLQGHDGVCLNNSDE